MPSHDLRRTGGRRGWRFSPNPAADNDESRGGALQPLGVATQVERPALGPGDAVADVLPALAVAVEMTMLELDTRAPRRLGDEAHLPLARSGGIGLEPPGPGNVPAHHHAVRRLVGEHAREAALASVDPAVVDVAAHPRLEHGLGDVDAEQVVVAGLEVAEPPGEDVEGALDRRVDDDRLPHGRVRVLGCLCAHGSPFSGCSTVAL